jgi:hypothetical protein
MFSAGGDVSFADRGGFFAVKSQEYFDFVETAFKAV